MHSLIFDWTLIEYAWKTEVKQSGEKTLADQAYDLGTEKGSNVLTCSTGRFSFPDHNNHGPNWHACYAPLPPSLTCMPTLSGPEPIWLQSPVWTLWSLRRPSHTLLCSIKLQTRPRYFLSKVSTSDNPARCQRECAGFSWPYPTTRLRSGYWFRSRTHCQHSLGGVFIWTVWLSRIGESCRERGRGDGGVGIEGWEGGCNMIRQRWGGNERTLRGEKWNSTVKTTRFQTRHAHRQTFSEPSLYMRAWVAVVHQAGPSQQATQRLNTERMSSRWVEEGSGIRAMGGQE